MFLLIVDPIDGHTFGRGEPGEDRRKIIFIDVKTKKAAESKARKILLGESYISGDYIMHRGLVWHNKGCTAAGARIIRIDRATDLPVLDWCKDVQNRLKDELSKKKEEEDRKQYEALKARFG